MSEISNEIGRWANQGWFGVAGAKLEDKAAKSGQKAEAEANRVKGEAAAAAAAEVATQEEKKKKAASLLAQPTSGFGGSSNTARQFLTSF